MISPEDLRARKVTLFATKDSVEDAMEYALSLCNQDKAYMTTALMIMINTLLEQLAKEAEEK